MVTPEDELEEMIRKEVPVWVEEMMNLINSVGGYRPIPCGRYACENQQA